MSDTTAEASVDPPSGSDRVAEATRASAAGADERLAYRGVFARLLIRPEIGAIIAAIAIWVMFWAISVPFGLASGASSILDVASSPLGIMAVAVAFLMIGGEFDLSSGAATGTLGIVIMLLVRDVTGDLGGLGLSLWLALPISLAIALSFGWFNGTVVNRTGLPSFIVTLGSFFIFKGAKLGYSKLIVDQIQVGKLDDLEIVAAETGGSDGGYSFFRRIFAAVWIRNDHVWEGRDFFYTLFCVGGIALILLAGYELHFVRKASFDPAGLVVFLVGAAGVVAGIVTLHSTDGTGGDTAGALIIGASILVGLFGLGRWRYEPLTERGHFGLTPEVITPIVSAVVALVVGIIIASILDPQASETVAFQFTEQGIRAIVFVILAGAAVTLSLIGAARARTISRTTQSAVLAFTSVLIAVVALFVRSESTTPKFRAQAFSVMLVLAVLMLTWAVVSMFFLERRHRDPAADRIGNWAVLLGGLFFIAGIVIRLLFVTQAELDGGISRTLFSVRTLWFLAFAFVASWVLGNTKFGSWTFAVGGNKQAARQIGVPANRTKVQLFMVVSFAAWLVGLLLAFRLNTIQASTGDGEEFEYIIAAVVGGTALTGGYGSTMGAAVGALIMAMAFQGIPSSRWNSDWRFVFLGAILLTAAIANNYIRSKAEAAR